jgi:hypothetical protein
LRSKGWVRPVVLALVPLILCQCERRPEPELSSVSPPQLFDPQKTSGLIEGFFPEPRGQVRSSDPLVQRAVVSASDWSKVRSQARRTVVHTWLVPGSGPSRAGMKGMGILVLDVFGQEPASVENEGLIFVDATVEQKPEILRLPDLGAFRPRFQFQGENDTVAEKFGRYRQRLMAFFPLRFLQMKGEFRVQFMPLGSDLVFETTPLQKEAQSKVKSGQAAEGIPDSKAVARLLSQSGFASAPR